MRLRTRWCCQVLFVNVYELTYRTEHTFSVSFRFRTQSTDGECRGDVGEAREFPDLAVPAVSGRGAIPIPLGSQDFSADHRFRGDRFASSAATARQELHGHFIHCEPEVSSIDVFTRSASAGRTWHSTRDPREASCHDAHRVAGATSAMGRGHRRQPRRDA
jgi:hypothetical protein